MALTLTQMQTEIQARGFNDITDTTRLNYWINLVYQVWICEADDWNFLRTSTSGVAPLTIADLRSVESVIDSTQNYKMHPLDTREITDTQDANLATTGTPLYYYMSSATQISVYPANTTDTLSVRYYKVPTALSSGSDTPIIPDRYQYLIVEGALYFAYVNKDDFDAAQAQKASFNEGLTAMRDALVGHDRPQEFIAQSFRKDY